VAGLHPDPLGELTALHSPLIGLKGRAGRKGESGRKERGRTPMSKVC